MMASQKKYSKRQKYYPVPPLLSWDIFIEGYTDQMALAKDMHQLKKLAKKYGWKENWDNNYALLGQGKVVLVTDLFLNIVFASSNLARLNGYLPGEVVGKKPSIFQGKDTDEAVKDIIRAAVEKKESFKVTLVNYTKGGFPYKCEITAYPVFNQKGEPVHFIAFEKSFTDDI